ncbi:MAG: ABC transporter ATP-binding protein [Acidobacteriota bacterium]|nr:ABC transporter ATP-binding protein [Acidobacteriota bacterium]
MRPAIELADVTKIYRRYGGKQFATLKSALLNRTVLRDLNPASSFAAVKNLSFSVPAGSTFGVMGRNGSGKSTALKLVAGITKPTSGTVSVQGRISALIELGAGFHPEISGRENVFINGIMLGFTKREIAKRFDEIVEFAEMKDFIDAPVKTYSSGMYMRLGFAVAIHVDPDVLLVDEVLAVGDEGFTHKCLDKFAEFKRRGRTILLVTHSLDMIEKFCDEAIWIDHGEKLSEGDPKRVVGAYLAAVEKTEEAHLAASDAKAQKAAGASDTTDVDPPPPTTDDVPAQEAAEIAAPDDGVRDMFQANEGRWGSREVEITSVELCGPDGKPAHVFQSGESMSINLRVSAKDPVEDYVFGIGLFNVEGVCCYGTNTSLEEYVSDRFFGEGEVRFIIAGLDLVPGTYKLDVAAHKKDGYQYDYHRLLYTFRVKSRLHDAGIYRPRHAWSFSGALALSKIEPSSDASSEE